ncbi:MAG: phosphoribosylaminoimidazolesuccinocarboxamide synthase [Candidatus Eisenbacteria bacterium]|nr:phosphoribosylaminoimidazolesuccinocarboxamide synthase [Candidatus Eisenbacteria bacterium]
MLIVTSDRISAFDRVLATPVSGKGKVLNRLSAFWFDRLSSIAPNHKITIQTAEFPEPFRGETLLEGRSMLVHKARVFPFECVVRGYLAGSGWRDYRKEGGVSGVSLPPGLRLSERLPEPIFTPSTKAENGHDEPVPFERMERELGVETARRLRDLSLALFREATTHAEARGILLADTKFEFGLGRDDRILLVDEALSPDSSRFWKAERYRAGEPQEGYDKQHVREYLLGIGWRGEAPAPGLPPEVIRSTLARYEEIFAILTGPAAAA